MAEINKEIFCIECQKNVSARLTSGQEVYPHRKDLSVLPFWICDTCKNFVGCHHKSENRTKPLGCIPNPHMKKARIEIHKILDPMWKPDRNKRRKIYSALSEFLGRKYHTADLRSIEEARDIYISTLKNGAGLKPIEFTRGLMSFLIKACPIFYGKSLIDKF